MKNNDFIISAPALGATGADSGNTFFALYAPLAERVEVSISPHFQAEMTKCEHGYWIFEADADYDRAEYQFLVDGESIPDPASRFQPKGVFGPSRVFCPEKRDIVQGPGISIENMVIYELHVGTFTPDGTFASAISRLDRLKSVGINAVELMPVAQFSGYRNWGYDGVFPFAAQDTYGGPNGLIELVSACHEREMAVFLDVVYNHLGPEGNQLHGLGAYFTDRYQTPWGKAMNFDSPYSHGVREFFIQNSLYWLFDLGIDGLRLDAVSAIHDASSIHFLEELSARVEDREKNTGRKKILIAECGQNNARNVRPRSQGGYGLRSMWSFDFHHSLHALMTGEDCGYYEDYGGMSHLVRTLDTGFAYQGEYSEFYRHYRGSDPDGLGATSFVGYTQSHDEVGNRGDGARFVSLVGQDKAALATALAITAPHVPMLFMGEEYGEDNPFYFFHDFQDKRLVNAVQRGRRRELKEFGFTEFPPPAHSGKAFEKSKLDWAKAETRAGKNMLELYGNLIRLRRSLPALTNPDKTGSWCSEAWENVLALFRSGPGMEPGVICFYNFSEAEYDLSCRDSVDNGQWKQEWSSSPTVTPLKHECYKLSGWEAIVLSRPGAVEKESIKEVFDLSVRNR